MLDQLTNLLDREVLGVASLGGLAHLADISAFVMAIMENVDLFVALFRTIDRLNISIPGVPPALWGVLYDVALTLLILVTLYRLIDRLTTDKTNA